MLANDDENDDGNQSTQELLLHAKQSNRKILIPVALGMVLSFAAVLYFVFRPGHSRPDLLVYGPPYTPKTFGAATPDAAAAAPSDSKSVERPVGPPGIVEITVGSGMALYIDGKAAGSGHKHQVKLSPGKHVVMVQQDTRTMVQKLDIGPGERFHVEFGSKVTVSKEIQ